MPRLAPDDDDALAEAFAREFAEAFAGRDTLTLTLTPAELLTLIGQVQLAARHPLNTGITGRIGIALVARWEREYFATGALREVVRRGWQSATNIEGAAAVIARGQREEEE